MEALPKFRGSASLMKRAHVFLKSMLKIVGALAHFGGVTTNRGRQIFKEGANMEGPHVKMEA